MGWRDDYNLKVQLLRAVLLAVIILPGRLELMHAEAIAVELDAAPEASRIDQLERKLAAVTEQNQRLAGEVQQLKDQAGSLSDQSPAVDRNAAAAVMQEGSELPAEDAFNAFYDNGMVLRLYKSGDSFELKTNLRTQFRLISFDANEDTWTDSAGVVRPIESRRNFDIERARLVLSGHAFTPQLKYFLQMDGDTDSRHAIALLDGWSAWHFSDAFELQLGKRKVPGSRNWMLAAFDTRLADRPFANEFFRPSRTTGIWAVGDPSKSLHYELMVGQGYNTEGLTPAETGNNFAASGTAWWDVIGDYGPARPCDFESHEEFAARIGSSWVTSIEGIPGRQLEEADFLRLTDGTRLTDTGALAPGATVESFDVTLLALDAAFKYRGWSANGEYFWRSVTDLKANLPVPAVGLQHGFYLEGGFFLLPQQLELNSQIAFVTGRPESVNSFATGFSYYPRSKQHLKLTMDVTIIDGSPVNSTGTDILVGDDGVLVRAQWQALY